MSSSSDWDHAEAQALVAAPRAEVAALFWDIAAWHAIWLKIDDVDVLYDDGAHQEFVMGVQRDGRREDVRTIRYRRRDGAIDFFSPLPPPTMVSHNGSWLFEVDPAQPDSCRVSARRNYQLIGALGETRTQFVDRRRDYRQQFEKRLQAILDCFVDHFATAMPVVSEVKGMTVCTEHIRIECTLEEIDAFLADVHNLPSWTGFFRSVGRPVGDRFEVKTAMGTTIRTRIERGDRGRYVISSLVGDCEERAELVVAAAASSVEVSFTVNVLPALADHAAGGGEFGAVDGVAVQQGRMRDELERLRAALTAEATVRAAAAHHDR